MKQEQLLLIIDIQKDYFEGGRMELHRPIPAARNAQRVLELFRREGAPVVHIRHEAMQEGASFLVKGSFGTEFHPLVEPVHGERVVTKNFPNSFRDTGLQEILKETGATELVVAGMMTHMCVSTTVRAAFDLGWKLTLLGDACATRALEMEGGSLDADSVHFAHLAALQRFGAVTDTTPFLAGQS